MKTLYIARHAKSDWGNPSLSDFDRPLNERGKKDAPDMGKRLRKRNISPDLVITSPAERAKKTAIKIAKEIGYPKDKIKEDKLLYLAGVSTVLAVVREVDDEVNSLIIFGHNPGWTDFANYLTANFIDNIPTCGVVAITFEVSSWKQIEKGKGKQMFFDYPKKES